MGAPWLNTKMVVAVSPDTDIDDAARRLSRDGDARAIRRATSSWCRTRAARPTIRPACRSTDIIRIALVGKIGIDATAKARHDLKDFDRAWPVNWGKVRLEDYL